MLMLTLATYPPSYTLADSRVAVMAHTHTALLLSSNNNEYKNMSYTFCKSRQPGGLGVSFSPRG